MGFDYDRFLDDARRLSKAGADVEKLLRFFRENGASPIDSIKMLREVNGVSLADAKRSFHLSEVWKDERPALDDFHERLEKEAREAVDSPVDRKP